MRPAGPADVPQPTSRGSANRLRYGLGLASAHRRLPADRAVSRTDVIRSQVPNAAGRSLALANGPVVRVTSPRRTHPFGEGQRTIAPRPIGCVHRPVGLTEELVACRGVVGVGGHADADRQPLPTLALEVAISARTRSSTPGGSSAVSHPRPAPDAAWAAAAALRGSRRRPDGAPECRVTRPGGARHSPHGESRLQRLALRVAGAVGGPQGSDHDRRPDASSRGSG